MSTVFASHPAREHLRLVPPSPEARCSAVVARQFSLWPFGTRTVRLYLLIDPSRIEPAVQRGVLRAMHEAFMRADTGSQTSAVRGAALAAHYVLRHRNRDVLPLEQITASVAVASTRGRRAYVCLIGDAAAFAMRSGALTGQRGGTRLLRPAGMEQDPRVALWSTPLDPGDRLVLVCGAPANADVPQTILDVVATDPPAQAEEHLAQVLSRRSRPVRALVAEAGSPLPAERRLRLKLVPPRTPGPPAGVHLRRLLALALPLAILCAAVLMVLSRTADVPSVQDGQHAQDLLAQVDTAPDLSTADALAREALDAASRAAASAPDNYSPVVDQIERKLDQVDRAVDVDPSIAVRLGPGAANVVDLASSDDTIYTLDPVEATVRVFSADALEQTPTQDSLLLAEGAPVGARRLAKPIAMQYVPGPSPADGELVVIDEARTIAQRAQDGTMSTEPLPSSGSWQQLGAIGSSPSGGLLVLDSGAQRVLGYSTTGQRLNDPPRLLLNGPVALDAAAWHHAAELTSLDDLYLRMDDGQVRRFDSAGHALSYDVRPPDAPLTDVTGLAPDRSGGLYLADPTHARIVQTTADGTFVRQFRAASLAGVRELQSSPDGRRLYALVPAGVLVFEVPASDTL